MKKSLNSDLKPIVRNFYNELKDAVWHPISYGDYNRLDDDGFIEILESRAKKNYSIDDFEYCTFVLSEKEQFLIKMYNSEYLNNVKELMHKLEECFSIKVCVNHDKGEIKVIKTNDCAF